jgi:hypothetical protein
MILLAWFTVILLLVPVSFGLAELFVLCIVEIDSDSFTHVSSKLYMGLASPDEWSLCIDLSNSTHIATVSLFAKCVCIVF